MERRRSGVSEVSEPTLGVERRPLIDQSKHRSCRGLSRSASVVDTGRASSSNKPKSLIAKSEVLGQQPRPLHRSQSAPYHLRCPQYRVNPVVKFDDQAIPERMNYGIAGYDTSRRRRSFSSGPDAAAIPRPRSFNTIPESPRARPRSFSTIPESPRPRPRSFSSVPSRSVHTPRKPATRAVYWRSLTQRFRDKWLQE